MKTVTEVEVVEALKAELETLSIEELDTIAGGSTICSWY
jgi:bacteriocin-like protein